jgi:hypothetical protein
MQAGGNNPLLNAALIVNLDKSEPRTGRPSHEAEKEFNYRKLVVNYSEGSIPKEVCKGIATIVGR